MFQGDFLLPLHFLAFVFPFADEDESGNRDFGRIEGVPGVGLDELGRLIGGHAVAPADGLDHAGMEAGPPGPILFGLGGRRHGGEEGSGIDHGGIHGHGLDAGIVHGGLGRKQPAAAETVDGQIPRVDLGTADEGVHHGFERDIGVGAKDLALEGKQALAGQVDGGEIVAPGEGLGRDVVHQILGKGLAPADHKQGLVRSLAGSGPEKSRQHTPFERDLEIRKLRFEELAGFAHKLAHDGGARLELRVVRQHGNQRGAVIISGT